ncbi:hypothetical protein SDC9_116242 [bioreactor metagenome]|uniref:Uncharacterized protein n=1 Tax=bioreactor metagenome TaxID=1076179 RepID=A0A645BVS5_9ZZZZ
MRQGAARPASVTRSPGRARDACSIGMAGTKGFSAGGGVSAAFGTGVSSAGTPVSAGRWDSGSGVRGVSLKSTLGVETCTVWDGAYANVCRTLSATRAAAVRSAFHPVGAAGSAAGFQAGTAERDAGLQSVRDFPPSVCACWRKVLASMV